MKPDPALAKRIRRQSYQPRPTLRGVRLVPLDPHADESGSLVELARLRRGLHQALPRFEVLQVNYSDLQPGGVKAWHLHKRQDDAWFVVPGARVVVGLWDVRHASPTKGETRRIPFGAGRPQLLFIPRGVAHGVANVGRTPAHLIYFANRHFDSKDADEYRLPWDEKGADFWSPRRD